jgi:hypothetical protein
MADDPQADVPQATPTPTGAEAPAPAAPATPAAAADATPIPARLERLDERVTVQSGWTSLLATVLIVVGGGAGAYVTAWISSIERAVVAAGPTQVEALPPEEDGEEEGKKGDAYDVGDIDQELQNQEFEQPSDAAPPDLAQDLLQLIDQTDFTDPNRDGNTGGGTEGGAGGLGEKGKGLGKGGRSRAQRWHIEYGNGSKDQYAKILDFFQIKLAAFRNGKCQAAEGFARGAQPKKYDTPPANLFFQVQEPARLRTDRELLRAAGVANGETDIMCQYYPEALAAQLLKLELAFANRKENEIATTRFGIRPAGDNSFELYVVDQIPL